MDLIETPYGLIQVKFDTEQNNLTISCDKPINIILDSSITIAINGETEIVCRDQLDIISQNHPITIDTVGSLLFLNC